MGCCRGQTGGSCGHQKLFASVSSLILIVEDLLTVEGDDNAALISGYARDLSDIAEAVLEHLAGAPLPSDEAVLRIFEETILMIDCAIRAFIGEDAGLG